MCIVCHTISAVSPKITNAINYCNVGARISGAEMFTGSISAVYMYNRALSNSEISTVYAATMRYF
jgi:hypothetical protein